MALHISYQYKVTGAPIKLCIAYQYKFVGTPIKSHASNDGNFPQTNNLVLFIEWDVQCASYTL